MLETPCPNGETPGFEQARPGAGAIAQFRERPSGFNESELREVVMGLESGSQIVRIYFSPLPS